MPELDLRPLAISGSGPPAVGIAREIVRWLTHSGELAVGDKLPSERELMAIFDVARSTVREALKTLSLLGLVEIRPGSGTYLKGLGAEPLPQVLEWGVMLGESRGRAIIEARANVEVILAGLAAERRTDEELERIQVAYGDLEQAVADRDIDAILRADLAFHRAVAEAAHSSVLADFVARLQSFLGAWTRRVAELRPDITATLDDHATILEQIDRSNEAGARERMRAHMQAAFEAFEPGSVQRARLVIAAIGQEEVQRLAEATGETCQIAVLEGAEAVSVACRDGTHRLRVSADIGRRLPANCTAVGKVLLSELAADEVSERLGDGPLPRLTAASITDLAALRRELAQVQAARVAFDDCESADGVRCIAAAVRNPEGKIVAGISISVPTVRWTASAAIHLTAAATEAATRMSHALGTPPWNEDATAFAASGFPREALSVGIFDDGGHSRVPILAPEPIARGREPQPQHPSPDTVSPAVVP